MPRRANRTASRSRPRRLLIVEIWSDDFARFGAAEHRHDFEGSARASPLQDPLLKESEVVALHDLKAATEVGLDPTIDVLQTLGKHSAFLAKAAVHRHHVAVLETLDHHEQHSAPRFVR